MTSETAFIEALRKIATDPAARGLADDAAVLNMGGTKLVLTHDMLVEGVHFLPTDPPADVAWKLLAVNLSDLAAKGARPVGIMMGYGLMEDADWDAGFVAGLGDALAHYGVPLLGGDTVGQPKGDARAMGLTAIGVSADAPPPARSGARAGDLLYVTGTIGDGWAGLQLLQQGQEEPAAVIQAYRRPAALLVEGQALAPHVHAMMDVSDGLLLDARRMADASGLALSLDLDAVPLSDAYRSIFGDTQKSRLDAAKGGDDYQLLFAAPQDLRLPCPATAIGKFASGKDISIRYKDKNMQLPVSLGYIHRDG
ncbi:thiamine-phosphate kinase [Sphingorhabdus sp. Alg239-R122]|uniref:thiamine-phosphate kinase n=1 Tax=Sphingorhabdus sp. Alg239-R122 TaxID=2305989 RepID=UPI0013DB5991|nr:thiamine-phosphate kinase [Sphingorhabdus sp. Alg239-R122]